MENYNGCNNGKEIIRVAVETTVEGAVHRISGLLVKATAKSLVVVVGDSTKIVFYRTTGRVNPLQTKLDIKDATLIYLDKVEAAIQTVFGSSEFDSRFLLKDKEPSVPFIQHTSIEQWAQSMGCIIYDFWRV